MNEWHGWAIAGTTKRSFHIGPIPGRKQIALYEEEGYIIRILAFFRTQEDAQKALWWLDAIAETIPIASVHQEEHFAIIEEG